MGCHHNHSPYFHRLAHNCMSHQHFIKNLFQENKVQKRTFADLMLFSTKYHQTPFLQTQQTLRWNQGIFWSQVYIFYGNRSFPYVNFAYESAFNSVQGKLANSIVVPTFLLDRYLAVDFRIFSILHLAQAVSLIFKHQNTFAQNREKISKVLAFVYCDSNVYLENNSIFGKWTTLGIRY